MVYEDGGVRDAAMRMLRVCCKMLKQYHGVEAEPYDAGSHAGIEVTRLGDCTADFVTGYAHGCQDHWNGEFYREEQG